MGKAEKGSIKWLANKMKAKGLQKLRWYCQMCQKQCRDENGFKCHVQSEAHQRQLLIFADNPNQFLGSFSKEFEDGYLNLLKRTHGTKRTEANKVYQEYIHDREHVHMNATKWETLTGFVQHLGRTGKCVVDETEKGWFVTWIDRDPETIARQESLAKRDKLDKDDEERLAAFIAKQVEQAKKEREEEGEGEDKYTELVRGEEEKLQLSLQGRLGSASSTSTSSSSANLAAASKLFKKELSRQGEQQKERKRPRDADQKKKSALEEIMEEERTKKQAKLEREEKERKSAPSDGVKDYWLKRDIVVKIVTKSLGDKYYKQKGHVRQVLDRYGAVVVLQATGAKLKLDQSHLETVIPAEGRPVLIVNGRWRGREATLKSLDVDSYSARLVLGDDDDDEDAGREVKVPYEHFSKLHVAKKD